VRNEVTRQSLKMKYLRLPEGKTIWSSLLPIFIASYLLFSMVSISLSQIFLALSLIFWIIMLIRERQKFTFPSFFWPLLVFAGLSLFSAFLSVDPKVSLKDSRDLLLFLIVPIVYMGFFKEKVLTKANLALLGSAYISCFYSFAQLIIKASLRQRTPGFMGQIMTQAGLLLLFSCLALSMFLFSRARIRYLWGLGLFFSLVALILTQTRSAWLGLIIAVSFILILYKPRILILVPVLVGLFLIVSPKSVTTRVLTLSSFKDYRLEYIKAGIKIIKDYPFFGTGSDTVEKVFQDSKYGLSEKAKKNVHLHNNIIQIAAERGIPSLIAWLTFMVLAFISLFKLLNNKDPTSYTLTVSGLAALLALFTAGFFEYNFADSEITALFLFLITIPFTLARIKPLRTQHMETKEKPVVKFKKKKTLPVLLILAAFFLVYTIWMSLNLFTFKTYRSPELKASPLEIEGIYHIHSVFSDGTKNVDEIVDIASQSSLDFIILTDHGSPNRESYDSQGWKEGVLVLAGTEISASRGHLVALDFELPSDRFHYNTEVAVYQILKAGGFSIISHPYSKTKWSWGEFIEYSGIDIMNADSMLRKDIIFSIPYLPAFFLKPKYFIVKILDNPKRNLRKWDELNTLHPIYGYFSTDAHLFYDSLFDLFHIHVLSRSPLSNDFKTARKQIYNALREGRFYNSIHAAAHGQGFRFWGEQDLTKIPMGGSASLSSPVALHIHAPFSFAAEIHLIHNGKDIFTSSEENVVYETPHPGIYRVEVFLKERSPLGKNIPWIISNPIFLKEGKNDRN